MNNLYIFSDIKIDSSNKQGSPSGLMHEIISIIKASGEFNIQLVYTGPCLASRAYLPINYIFPILHYWLRRVRPSLNKSVKTYIVLYPSRLRILAFLFTSPTICIGPDDTDSVLAHLCSTEARMIWIIFRKVEKLINRFVEYLTPSVICLFVGKSDMQNYLKRNPSHTAYYIPHPLFKADLIDLRTIKEKIHCSSGETEKSVLRLLVYGSSFPDHKTIQNIEKFVRYLAENELASCNTEICIYGKKNIWMKPLFDSLSGALNSKCLNEFNSFLDILEPSSALVCFAPYKFGTKTRVLSALANAIPCFCPPTSIPDQIKNIQNHSDHTLNFFNNSEPFQPDKFFSVESRIRLASLIREQDTGTEIVQILSKS